MSNSLSIQPIDPVPDGQPSLFITFTCVKCGKTCRTEQQPGFVPRYCNDCAAVVEREKNAERQRKWREKHPGGNTKQVQKWRKDNPVDARQAAAKQNAKRPRKTAQRG